MEKSGEYQDWWEGSCGAGGRGSSGGRVEDGLYREVRGVEVHGGIGILLFARAKNILRGMCICEGDGYREEEWRKGW